MPLNQMTSIDPLLSCNLAVILVARTPPAGLIWVSVPPAIQHHCLVGYLQCAPRWSCLHSDREYSADRRKFAAAYVQPCLWPGFHQRLQICQGVRRYRLMAGLKIHNAFGRWFYCQRQPSSILSISSTMNRITGCSESAFGWA